MKGIRRRVVVAGLMMLGLGLALNAQSGRGQGMRGEMPDSAGFARHMDRLSADLKLDEKQKVRVAELERAHLQTMEKERNNRQADRTAHTEAMQQLRKQHEADMKKVLTEEQYTLWLEGRQQQVRERRHDGRGQGKGGYGPGRGGRP